MVARVVIFLMGKARDEPMVCTFRLEILEASSRHEKASASCGRRPPSLAILFVRYALSSVIQCLEAATVVLWTGIPGHRDCWVEWRGFEGQTFTTFFAFINNAEAFGHAKLLHHHSA